MAAAASRSIVPPLVRTLCKDPAWADGDDVVERWHALMSRPVPKGIKYGKSLQRILGHPAALYTVVEYKDVALFVDEAFAATVRSPLDAEDWRALHAANRLVACALGHDLDRAPSRDEIQSNIQSSKTKKAPNVGSVTQACKMAYAGLGECLDDAAAAAISERAAAADDQELTAAWAEMLRSTPDFAEACTQRRAPPAAAWSAVPPGARSALVAALASADSRGWGHVDQLNGYARISSNIPTGVMSRIETMASKLASDLQSGSVTMETLNLQNIGEQVLSDCDANDLSKLSGNINELLPVLSQMAPGMPGMAGVPGMGGGMPPIGNLPALQ